MREDRARRVIELLGEEKFADTRKEMLEGKDVSKEVVIATNDDSPLWEFMKTILEQTGELQVVDLQDTLLHFGRKVTRQAVESALGAHKETFQTVVRSRDKFVSLKR
jgi:shikimate kinase